MIRSTISQPLLARRVRPQSGTVSAKSWPDVKSRRYNGGSPSKPSYSSPAIENPKQYNPPSHPTSSSRHRSSPSSGRYGGSLSESELAAQKARMYPNMMPAEGTFFHWFLTNKQIHVWISMSVLTTLGLFTSIQSINHWRETNPVAIEAHLPSPFNLIWKPFSTWPLYVQTWRLYKIDESNKVAARRQRKVDDTDHQRAYRKAHGVDEGFLRGLILDNEEPQPASAQSKGVSDTVSQTVPVDTEQSAVPKRKVKRWLGIWE